MTSRKPSSNNYFAEIIESSLSNFLAQSWKWDFFPTFGSLLELENGEITILGVVTEIETGSLDPIRYPFPYQKTELELKAEQPQIFEFLKTTFRVQICGYLQNEKIYYLLPSKPSKIHSFVSDASSKNIKNFFSKSDYLYLLFAFENQIKIIDELLLAILKNLSTQKLLDNNVLDDFCKTFSLLTGNDYMRLKLFLRRVENLQH